MVTRPLTDRPPSPGSEQRRPSWLDGRAGWAAVATVAAVLGAGVAVLAALVSRLAWRPDPVVLPGGLVLGVAASASIVFLARAYSRGIGLAAAGGWIIGTGLVLSGRPEGDYLLARDALGLGYLLVSAVVVIGAAAGGAPR